MTELDFKGLNDRIIPSFNTFIIELLPGGKMVGKEYVCGSINGGSGGSFSVNSKTGAWAEFSGGNLKGGDLISLYAAVKSISQKDAFTDLSIKYGGIQNPPTQQEPPSIFKSAPDKHDLPNFGDHTDHWAYRDSESRVMFYIARYDKPDGKSFVPFSWNGEKWLKRGWPSPRPLYNLDIIKARPDDFILIVEGEKCAEAVKKIVKGSRYIPTTWPNGSSSVRNVDFTPIKGRKILIWPDNDKPGIDAALKIFAIINDNEVKIINPTDKPDSWDAADALNEGMDWNKFKLWALERVKIPLCEPEINKSEPEVLDPAVSSNIVMWEELGLPISQSRRPIGNLSTVNIRLTRSPDFQHKIWADTFHQRIMTTIDCEQPRFWNDTDTLRLTHRLQSKYGLHNISKDVVYDGICLHASMCNRNEPRDWMDSLIWDQVPRIESFLPVYMGTPDTEYDRMAGKNWWVALAARTFVPGCQVDNLIIFKSPKQGTGKTSTLRIIGDKWYAAAGHDIISKDFYLALQGKLIIEVDELTSFKKSEIETVKAVISRRVDRYRAVYGTITDDHPRQCVFTATTNEKNPLIDRSGNRRFWPVDVTKIDLDAIARDRQQLFAEAVYNFKTGTSWHNMPDETEHRQNENMKEDPWLDPVLDYIQFKDKLTIHQIMNECLHIPIERHRLDYFERIAHILQKDGWSQKGRFKNPDGSVSRSWVKYQPPLPPLPLLPPESEKFGDVR